MTDLRHPREGGDPVSETEPGASAFLDSRFRRNDERRDWTREEIRALFDLPLLDLLFEAQTVHRRHHARNEVQLSTLLSIKTGGCPEDCGYCSQSAHAKTGLKAEKLMDVDAVLAAAAWRTARTSISLVAFRPVSACADCEQ